MRKSLLSLALIAGLFLPIGTSQAQDTNTVTATCKDGTTFTGRKRSGACRGHGGVQSWSTAANTAICNTFYANGIDEPARRSEPWWRSRSGLGQYREQGLSLPGTRWYGKTKQGSYMSEAEAKAQGSRPDHGKACSS